MYSQISLKQLKFEVDVWNGISYNPLSNHLLVTIDVHTPYSKILLIDRNNNAKTYLL